MFRRLMLAAFMAASLVSVPAASPVAAAGRPQVVSIVSHMTIADPEPNYGTFTTLGSSLICRKGSVLDTSLTYGDYAELPNGAWVAELFADKTFSCGVRGDVYISLDIHWYITDTLWLENFTWTVTGGTGAFVNLRGRGIGVTDTSQMDNGSNVNYYFGSLSQ